MNNNKCTAWFYFYSKLIYNNLMWDKRVFRGNTHAALVTLKNVDNTQQAGQTHGGSANQNQ